jgi:prepilin-type N-terminal cleavage/methylation domain-containing protein
MSREPIMKHVHASQAGFTLIELMVVIVIIGILVTLAMPTFAAMSDRARVASIKQNAHTLQVVIESEAVPRGQYPADVSEIVYSDAYKVFTNPMTSQTGPGLSGGGAWCLSTDGAADGAALPGGFSGGQGAIGDVIYVPMNAAGNAVASPAGSRNVAAGEAKAYIIFGVGLDAKPIRRFLLSNGFANSEPPTNAAGLAP